MTNITRIFDRFVILGASTASFFPRDEKPQTTCPFAINKDKILKTRREEEGKGKMDEIYRSVLYVYGEKFFQVSTDRDLKRRILLS